MNIALTWAAPTNPPGSAAQAIRGHVIGLTQAGHDVTVYYDHRLNRLSPDHDALIWPSNLFNVHQIKADALDGVHRHFHLIGVDEPGNAVAFQEALDTADSLSAVDPNAALWFADRFDVDLADIAIIPNAPNRDLFPKQEPTPDGYVFAPKVGAPQKEGHGLAEIAELTPNQTYRTHAADRSRLPWLPFNVHVDPPLPWSLMPEAYAGCAFVANPARHEGLPNVAYEAFCSGRAYVSRKEALGMIQSLPAGEIRPEDFGTRANWFNQQYGEIYHTGDHVATPAPDKMAERVRLLGDDTGRAEAMGERARAWIGALDWEWVDTARAIVGAIEDG